MRPSLSFYAATFALLALGCDAPSASSDAGLDAGADAGPWPTSPAAPATPSPVALECPDGYREVELEGGVRACDPWAGERPRCAPGELLRPGEGCVPLATDCADVPPEASEPGAAYVVPGSTGGDGSVARPFGTIRQALSSGATVIALGPGEHRLGGTVHGVVLVGACPTTTTLHVPFAAYQLSGETTLRRLRVTGAQLTVSGSGSLTLESVEIAGTELAGIEVHERASLALRRVSIRDIDAWAIGGFDSEAMSFEDVAFERITGVGIRLQGVTDRRARISLTNVVIAEVGDSAILLEGAASLEVRRLVIEDATRDGINALETANAMVEDTVLRRFGGVALSIEGSSEIARVWVAGARAGVHLKTGEHRARDLVISDTAEIGLAAVDATGHAERVDVRRAGGLGVNVDGGRFTVRQLRVSGVVGTDEDSGGAMLVEDGGTATLEGALLENTEHFGLGVTHAAVLHASDVEVRSVRPRNDAGGYGVVALEGSTLSLTRASIHDVNTVGLSVEDSNATVSDLSVRGVSAPDMSNGIGVQVLGESRATVDAASITDTVRWGVLVYESAASLTASDLDVQRTRAAPCPPEGCAGDEGGAGIVAADGALVVVSRFRSRENDHAGVLVTAGSTLDLTQGLIEANGFGTMVTEGVALNPPPPEPGLRLREVETRGNMVENGAPVAIEPPQISLM